MGVILWAGLRQVEAFRRSLVISLDGDFFYGPRDNEPLKVKRSLEWLGTQGLPDVDISNLTPKDPFGVKMSWGMDSSFCDKVGNGLDVLACRSEYGEIEDFGVERSGAGWTQVPNFIITSAFVRILGASEQFELDVIKALLYYRPSGVLGHPDDQIEIEVEPDVVLEKPEIKSDVKYYTKPALWTWVKPHAENNGERAKVLKRVFDISTLPVGFKSAQKDAWYEKRNGIAHGRAKVEMTLSEYVEVEAYIAKSALFVAQQCKEKYKLII